MYTELDALSVLVLSRGVQERWCTKSLWQSSRLIFKAETSGAYPVGSAVVCTETNTSPHNVSGCLAILWLLLVSGSVGCFMVTKAHETASLYIFQQPLASSLSWLITKVYVCRKTHRKIWTAGMVQAETGFESSIHCLRGRRRYARASYAFCCQSREFLLGVKFQNLSHMRGVDRSCARWTFCVRNNNKKHSNFEKNNRKSYDWVTSFISTTELQALTEKSIIHCVIYSSGISSIGIAEIGHDHFLQHVSRLAFIPSALYKLVADKREINRSAPLDSSVRRLTHSVLRNYYDWYWMHEAESFIRIYQSFSSSKIYLPFFKLQDFLPSSKEQSLALL